jgi:hypothetical protein
MRIEAIEIWSKHKSKGSERFNTIAFRYHAPKVGKRRGFNTERGRPDGALEEKLSTFSYSGKDRKYSKNSALFQ